jgi:hypothetical protein
MYGKQELFYYNLKPAFMTTVKTYIKLINTAQYWTLNNTCRIKHVVIT